MPQITNAYSDWLTVHDRLTDAEQQCQLLPANCDPRLLEASTRRVQDLRVESDAALDEAQRVMRTVHGLPPPGGPNDPGQTS